LWRGITKGKERGKGGGKKKRRERRRNQINLTFYTLYTVRTSVSTAKF
jgi:hypothetical protein